MPESSKSGMTKNLSVEKRLLKALAQKRFERRLRQKRRKQARNRARSGAPGARLAAAQEPTPPKGPPRPGWTDLATPADLDLNQHRDASCAFIQRIGERVRQGQRLRLVFDECKTIRLSALVLLLAQIHKLQIEFGDGVITSTYPPNPKIERFLADIGFYELLHVKRRKNVAAHSRLTRFIRFKSEQKPNSAEIPKLRTELLGKDLKMPGAIARLIFRALSEAMTNVNHHAYKTKPLILPGLEGRWWMAASLSARTSLFTLAFYDAGVGIPKTLPRKYPLEKIRGILSLLPGVDPDDGQMIHAAMGLGRTRTEQTNRGKGLMDLVKLIDTVGAGAVHIHSLHGAYAYAPRVENHRNHEGFVEGTLIEWQLPLDKALENLPQELANELAEQNY